MKKGQISVEFIIILTLLFFVLLFSFAIFSERTTGLIHSQELSESKLIANKIARTINSVALAGDGVETKLLLEKKFDYNVDFFENSVRVHFRDQFVSVPITTSEVNIDSLTPGGFVKISNQNGQVLIEDVIKILANLTITQSTYSVTLEESESNVDTFQLCNNSTVALNSIAFADSGTIATWIDQISTIPSLSAGTCTDVSFTINVPASQPDGDYTGAITATDDGGTGSNTDSLAITVTVFTPSLDVTPPVVLLEAPASGYDDADGTIQFDYNVVDSESDIASCSLIINGATDQTDITITEGITQSFTKTGLTNGAYTWDVDCTDDSSNSNIGTSGESRPFTVTITVPDTTPPIVLLEAPASGYDDADGTIQFDYNVVDSESGIASCSLLINGSVDQTDVTITEGITQSFTKTGLVDGSYTWDVNCTDDSINSNVGTSGESRPFTVTIPVGPQTITRWATVALVGTTNITKTADNTFDQINNNNLVGTTFDVTSLTGTITQVEIIWSHEVSGTLNDDIVTISYGLTSYDDIIANTYNSGNTPVDHLDTLEANWEIIDVTSSRPGGGSWTFSDFSGLQVGGLYNKSKGPDSNWRLDAVGVRITYNA